MMTYAPLNQIWQIENCLRAWGHLWVSETVRPQESDVVNALMDWGIPNLRRVLGSSRTLEGRPDWRKSIIWRCHLELCLPWPLPIIPQTCFPSAMTWGDVMPSTSFYTSTLWWKRSATCPAAMVSSPNAHVINLQNQEQKHTCKVFPSDILSKRWEEANQIMICIEENQTHSKCLNVCDYEGKVYCYHNNLVQSWWMFWENWQGQRIINCPEV